MCMTYVPMAENPMSKKLYFQRSYKINLQICMTVLISDAKILWIYTHIFFEFPLTTYEKPCIKVF